MAWHAVSERKAAFATLAAAADLDAHLRARLRVHLARQARAAAARRQMDVDRVCALLLAGPWVQGRARRVGYSGEQGIHRGGLGAPQADCVLVWSERMPAY